MKKLAVRFVALALMLSGLYVIYTNYPTNPPAAGTVFFNEELDYTTSVPVIQPPAEPTSSPSPEITQTPTVKLGSVFATLSVPKLDKKLKIKEGVREQDIKKNPGHYPGTAMPGEVGNFAVAGHRIRAIFRDVHELRAGDVLHVDFNKKRYTYKLYRSYIVNPDAWEVISDDVAPGKSIVTITTCLLKADGGNSKRQILNFVLSEVS